MKHTIAVIGAGGRESVLVESYSKSPQVGKILVMPGNDLIQSVSRIPVQTFPDVKTHEVDKIIHLCVKHHVTLVDIAQEAAVEAGLADLLAEKHILYTGPTKAAGQLEWDKAWARDFMSKFGIPHPQYHVFTSPSAGKKHINSQSEGKWFIKASGLAEGKGVLPATNKQEALEAIDQMTKFHQAGETFLIEEWLEGEEFSTYVVTDGHSYQIIGSAQDHKRAYNFDQGLNTGGMGCSSPPLLLTPKIIKQIDAKIIAPTIKGMAKLGRPYTGILYVGGMISGGKPSVIEFNARWGDPEAQVVVPGIKTDLYQISLAVAKKSLAKLRIKTDSKARVAVVGASNGYPGDYSAVKGKRIFGLDRHFDGVQIYGAGITKTGRNYYAAGGRLFHLVGEGKTVLEARQKAYSAISQIYLEGNNLHYRTDIGWRDVARLTHS